MTTVVIGRECAAQSDPGRDKSENTGSRPVESAAKREEAVKNVEASGERPAVRCFSSPVPLKRHIQLRGVFIVELLLSAAAGLFVWLSVVFGSEELRAAVTEAVMGVLNG